MNVSKDQLRGYKDLGKDRKIIPVREREILREYITTSRLSKAMNSDDNLHDDDISSVCC